MIGVIERVLCRTIGCSSLFAKVSGLPHRFVCTPFVSLTEKIGVGWTSSTNETTTTPSEKE